MIENNEQVIPKNQLTKKRVVLQDNYLKHDDIYEMYLT